MNPKEYETALYRAVFEAERPKGEYRKEAFFPINDRTWKQMQWAKRDDLLVWALLESDDRNLAYIRSRMALWDTHPECRTLAELEATLTNERS
jgi:hypothetical protein